MHRRRALPGKPNQSGHREFAMNLEQQPCNQGRIALALAVAAACGAGSAPVFAQEPESSSGLDEIIVTARFREEKLQETPIAITAITADELAERGMQNAYEIAYTVPNASLRPTQAAFGA